MPFAAHTYAYALALAFALTLIPGPCDPVTLVNPYPFLPVHFPKARASKYKHKTRQDKTRQDKTRQDKTRQDKTRQDKTRQDKTRQDLRKNEGRVRARLLFLEVIEVVLHANDLDVPDMGEG